MGDEVPIINRITTVVEPLKPFLSWADSLDDHGPRIESLSREQRTSVYLIEDDDGERALRRHWAWIFEEKLHAWHRDPRAWPRRRTYRMFREWFDVRLVHLVFDLADAPVLHEEF